MKLFLQCLLIFLPLSLYAVNDDTFLEKIKTAQAQVEKETAYLKWVSALSQFNTVYCDSIIQQRQRYIKDFSDDAKVGLVILYLNNSRIGGSSTTPLLEEFNFNPADLPLMRGLVKCFKNEQITKQEFKRIKNNLKSYDDPTRSCIYYAISTCIEGVTKEKKVAYFNTALKHAKRSHLKSIFSSILDVYSTFHLENEDFVQAISYHQKGVTYAKNYNLKANLMSHLINLGHIHYELGDLNKSKEALLEALKLSSDLKVAFVLGQLYNQLGEVFNEQGKLNESIRFYQQSLIRFYSIDNTQGIASVHKNIGRAYYRNGDIGLAEKNYLLSEEFSKLLNENSFVGELHYFMSELYFGKNQVALAESHIQKSIKSWKKNELLIPLNRAYFLYAKIKRKQGDIKNAYAYLDQYLKFSDSIHSLETNKKVAELSEMFKSEQKERKIAEQEKELKQELSHRLLVQNKLENSKQQNRLVIIILVISLVLFVAIFVIIRNKNRQEQLLKKQREIELQQTLLRVQMNPHFIFNAMSVIQSYIYDKDIANSSKFLIHFSKLMRMILENNTKEFIPLEIELEIINRYLVLQKMRFEERFDFEIIDDEILDLTVVSIPPMLVQPFIENAIEHGDLDQLGNGLIRIYCEIVEDLFIFTIEDNGIGRQASLQKRKSGTSENHRSMAIELTQKRISLLNEKYKSSGYLVIQDLDATTGTGTKVSIATPFIKRLLI